MSKIVDLEKKKLGKKYHVIAKDLEKIICNIDKCIVILEEHNHYTAVKFLIQTLKGQRLILANKLIIIKEEYL